MQKSAASGSHGMGVAVGEGATEDGTVVAVGVEATDRVADGAVAVIAIGAGAQAVRRNREIRKVETRFM